MKNRIVYSNKECKLTGFPEDKTMNIIVLYSGGFDSTALLDLAIKAKNENKNIKTIYALYVKSNLLPSGKVKLEEEYIKTYISYINKDKKNVRFIKAVRNLPRIVEFSKYMDNAYDLIFINAINSIAPFIGGADINIIFNGALDRDSRSCHLPYYKDMVESFNKTFQTVDIWMEFPLIRIDKSILLTYILNNKLYHFCTCCEHPESDVICESCKGHLNGLIKLLLEYDIDPSILDDDTVKFVRSEVENILSNIRKESD